MFNKYNNEKKLIITIFMLVLRSITQYLRTYKCFVHFHTLFFFLLVQEPVKFMRNTIITSNVST